jgi:hypothetical protein
MRRIIWLPIAGFLLIAGATVAVAAPGLARDAAQLFNGTLAPAASPDPSAAPTPTTEKDPLLSQVLADLVTQGVITQDQSDAITKALQAKVDEQRAQAEQRRQEMQQEWQQIQGFLQDGVITQDEIDQLPADSALRQAFDSIAKNGQVTLDQLRQLGPGFGAWGPGPGGFGPGFGPGRDHMMGGPGGMGPWSDPNSTNTNPGATPIPTSGQSS